MPKLKWTKLACSWIATERSKTRVVYVAVPARGLYLLDQLYHLHVIRNGFEDIGIMLDHGLKLKQAKELAAAHYANLVRGE